jgi:hypothetical protein
MDDMIVTKRHEEKCLMCSETDVVTLTMDDNRIPSCRKHLWDFLGGDKPKKNGKKKAEA